MTPHAESRDFRAYLSSIWRWKFLVIGLLLVVPAISYALEVRKTPQYRSSALVQVQSLSIDPSLFPSPPSGSAGVLTVARLIETRSIAAAAGELLDPPVAGGAVSGLIEVSPDVETGFLSISATSPSPPRAAAVANAFARAIAANRAAEAKGRIESAIGGYKRQLAGIRDQPRGAPANPQVTILTEQIKRLRTLRGTLRPDQGIVETAVASATPVGRSPRRAIGLGAVIALLLSAGAVAVAESSDRRLRTPEDLEDLTGLPLLSAIPASAFTSEEGEARDEEAFQMLRGALTYFNVDRRLSSLVIVSAGQEDGKTTVAVRLAYAMARSGSNVILVDADLRRPSIAPRLGLPQTDGLGSVLVGTRDLSEALIQLPIRVQGAPEITVRGSLRLLPAGASAPNPGELLSSPVLRRVLAELEEHSDMVVVDSAAALAVSDTLPLLQVTSGVVIVARLDVSTRAAVRRLQQIVTAASGAILGVVATGAGVHGGYEYGYKDASVPRSRFSRKKRKTMEPTPAPLPLTRDSLDA